MGPRGLTGCYRKVHLSRQDGNWAKAGDNVFPLFDLPFARLGLLAGDDLLFPESAESLAKRGTDLICTPAAWTNSKMCFIWEARMGEQAHLVVANQWGERAGEVRPGDQQFMVIAVSRKNCFERRPGHKATILSSSAWIPATPEKNDF
ncbi:MAG: nitrilase-related carbon-nitrogen hydrolase [Candidatus Syntrophopropionicum ammoniitolerans]